MTASDLFDRIVGQERAVERLRASLESPVHAYLLVGPPGAGSIELAHAFAGELLARRDPEGAERHRLLASARRHPAVVSVEREGPAISVEQAQRVVATAAMRPSEGDRQVVILNEMHLVSAAAPTLLKTIEEPPESTVFVVLADEVTPELVTIASRCVVIEVPPLAATTVAAALVREGVDPTDAEVAAAAAAGDLAHARLLCTDDNLAVRNRFWNGVPDRLTGGLSTVMALVDEAIAHLDAAVEPVVTRQAEESARLDAVAEQTGVKRTGRKELDDAHRREQRRIRTIELETGLAAIGRRYRIEFSHGGSARAYAAAGEVLSRTAQRMVFNASERLLLASCLAELPRL